MTDDNRISNYGPELTIVLPSGDGGQAWRYDDGSRAHVFGTASPLQERLIRALLEAALDDLDRTTPPEARAIGGGY